MTQPFREGTVYRSRLWPELLLELTEDRIEALLPGKLHVLSSAVHPGGFSRADRMVNWRVPLSYDCSDPVGDLVANCERWGCDPSGTVGFITAAELTQASVEEREGGGFRLVCVTTAGTGNAARAGLRRSVYAAYTPGTINTMLFIDGGMTASAMVNAVITATEAKSAALQKLGIRDKETGEQATGTTTDALAVALSQQGPVHAYAGSATTIGCAIGEAVYRTVLEACGSSSG